MNNYATFWQRFAAMWIDFFVLLPLMVVQGLLESVSKGAALALVIPMAVAYAAYSIYCHGRFGQTVGKRVMGIRVIRTTGERIGWREAWLRSSGLKIPTELTPKPLPLESSSPRSPNLPNASSGYGQAAQALAYQSSQLPNLYNPHHAPSSDKQLQG